MPTLGRGAGGGGATAQVANNELEELTTST